MDVDNSVFSPFHTFYEYSKQTTFTIQCVELLCLHSLVRLGKCWNIQYRH